MSALNLVNPRQNWPRPCKCTVSVNTDIHKCLMTSCYHHCTAAEEYRSPGRYETLPCHRMPGFAWIVLHQLPWWSHSMLDVPDSAKKSFCQAYGGFNSEIPFWNRFLKQSLLHTVELVSSCKQQLDKSICGSRWKYLWKSKYINNYNCQNFKSNWWDLEIKNISINVFACNFRKIVS